MVARVGHDLEATDARAPDERVAAGVDVDRLADERREPVLHAEILSARRSPTKLKYLAASESGVGVFINDVAPEEAARLLHERRRAP